MSEREAVLEATDVRLTVGRTPVLRGVSVRVAPGSVLAVLGPTGAGKTTLLRALVGDRLADGGVVRLGGVDVTRLPLWRRARMGLGYVPQTPSVLPDLSVRANLETFERLVAHAARGPACWAELVGLGARLAVRASELSGGERRLLELARALVGRPRVLVCDEPFAGIDPLASSRVAALLRAEAERGLAVLLSDHHAALALRLCDRAQLLLGGEMHVEQVPERFARDPLVREHYLGPG